jgi:hypothetical protein
MMQSSDGQERIDPRKRRLGRRPGRAGRPQKPLTTHLSSEDLARLRAIVRARHTSVYRFLKDALLAAMAGINPDEYSRHDMREISDAADFHQTGHGLQRDQTSHQGGTPLPRLRERDLHDRLANRPPPPGHDSPTTVR